MANSWMDVIVSGTKLLGLSRACYVVYGTYMDFKTPSNIVSIAYVLFHFFWISCGCLLIFACMGIISDKSNTPVAELRYIFREPMLLFIILPQSLGYLGAPQLWSTIYFLLCFILLLNHQVLQIEIVERCITDLNYHFKHYSDYILGGLCLIGVLCGIALVSKDMFVVDFILNHNVVLPVKTFTVAITATLICWIYGVQHFSDDFHFMTGKQPARYWKIFWYIMPVIFWLGTMHTFIHLISNEFLFFSFIFVIIYISPLPIMAVTAIFEQLKQHNLIGVVQAQERWGPPDPQERHLRHLFNPREETRSRRRNEFCKHKCFLNSKILLQAIEEEESMRMNNNYEVKVREGSDDESSSDDEV